MTTASSPRSGPVSPFRVRVSGGSMSGHHDGSGLVQALTSADPYSRSTYGGFGHESHGHAPHHLHTTSPTMAIGGGGAHVDDGEGVTGGAEEEERLFQCDQCQKRFLRQYNLNAHLKTHSLERNHPCDQCPKSFLRPYDLSRHQRIHTKDKPYTCKICGLIFIRNDAIWRHYRKAHQGHPDVPTSRREKSLVSKAAAGMPSSAARQMMSSSPPPSFD
ncbi:hypothetical protein BGZ83_008008 [Gryganskiella cystojenkinii]|nr:hypothetical protein BGZ83_008008 [Gryganskiella cystojenkinii]